MLNEKSKKVWSWFGFCYLTKFAHSVTLEPEVTGVWYSGLWTLIGCTLCVLSRKTIGTDSFFECVILHGITLNELIKVIGLQINTIYV